MGGHGGVGGGDDGLQEGAAGDRRRRPEGVGVAPQERHHLSPAPLRCVPLCDRWAMWR